MGGVVNGWQHPLRFAVYVPAGGFGSAARRNATHSVK